MAGTRPRSIITERKGKIPQVIHNIDQFHWYRDAKRRTAEPDAFFPEEALSAVRFMLPYVPGKESPCYVVVVGDGSSIGEIYLARVNWGMDMLTGITLKQKSGLWKVFSYIENRSFHDAEETRKIVDKLPIKLGDIFTTDVMPFMKGGDYPLECDRIYGFDLFGSDSLRIIARNRQERNEENFEAIWVPDSRDGPERSLIKLPSTQWIIPRLVDSLPFTEKFSFSSTTNTFAL